MVICPTNAQCDTAAQTFRQNGIPASYRNTDLYRVTQVTSFMEGCAAWAAHGHEKSNYRLADLLRQWRSILGLRAERKAEVALTALLMEFASRDREPARHLLDAIYTIGLAPALRRPALAADAIEATKMIEAYTAGSVRHETVRDLANRALRVDRVEITTMSSSKGLEFDVVIILGMDQNRVPFFDALSNPEKMAEERRKFYVSLTRARDRVHIYYSGFVEWARRKDRAGPSQFLAEIGLV